jgi:hypothetical protein
MRGAVSRLFLIGLAAFGACAGAKLLVVAARAGSSGDWRITEKTDAITGLPASTALLRSSKTMNSALAFTPASYLQLGCFKGKPSVGFAFEFDVGSTKDSEFGYRFDAKPGRRIGPRFLSNHSTIVIEAKADVEQFAAELTASKTLFVQIRSLTEGQTSAQFQVDGAQSAIAAAFAGCPLSSR